MDRCQPQKAASFQTMARIPGGALPILHVATGQSGFYVEPRAPDGRQPDPAYLVIWTPSHRLDALRTQKATDDRILAIARQGLRHGVRCRKQHGKDLWAALRPGQTWVDPVGPLPRGVSKDILQSIATTLAWPARPLQPLHSAKEGVTWSFLASTPPAQDHVQIEGSLVVITKQERVQRQDPTLPRLIAPKATMDFLAKGPMPASEDPLQTHDPWARVRATIPAPVATALTQLHSAPPPTPDNTRVTNLETRLAKMEQAQADDAQQIDHIKKDVSLLNAKVDNGFSQVATNLTQQLAQLQAAMTTSVTDQIAHQLTQFEGLLKRPRVDS